MSPTDCEPLGEAICARLAAEIRKLGFAEDSLSAVPVYAQARFAHAKDPYSGLDSVVGVWLDRYGYRVGEIKLHGDGSFYAEFDVALPHPTNGRWFVEAVAAWGRDGVVKSEAKLLPAFVRRRMADPYEIYDMLQDYAAGPEIVREVVIGLVWTYCEAESVGLAMSPGIPTRTLPWPGQLRGKTVAELARGVREFEPYLATVGMAAVNAAVNRRAALPEGVTLEPGANGNLAVFEHFLPLIQGKKTVVVGRYPGLDAFVQARQLDVTVLERNPGPGDLTDAACEYRLPEAEWVFLTASSIPNKTFPRLAELSRDAVTVLMGPTTPWLPEWRHFGIDFLAGVEVADREALRATVAEGGGVRLFDGAVRYRVSPLGGQAAEDWAQTLIARAAGEKAALTRAMDDWYVRGETRRFPRYGELQAANLALSRLDTCFKRLWDARHGR